ncbi:MAG: type I DNA topoisomerase [Roseomonas sp.]|nr:type I DNA topoisomerase [Roseomonas sp.]MCA3328841.1 type I DNA topoisomerase [Roseomonas sp.]MCA3330353.1 type I DNA topoisomerase [Roseomonas sp.]MCA3335196.1 type I DNA topoisomerase [Roseomonas sp.]MCA3348172.1 type I DNA topoisomerase [Roseomonas sp.]
MSDVVVVESPAKAKTIEKYLGRDFTVLASYGHVRDLEEKDGAVLPDQDFAMLWGKDPRGEQQVGKIASALKGAKRLFLATDPDREGEAISWHVKDMLAERGALKGKHVQRITFNEITKRAVQYAVAHPRDLDQPLIEAYLARRALDYLVGYTLSPVLWRKLPGSRSAGRVQSVALRLICEREAEIEAFRAREYWTIEGRFTTAAGAPFTARLTHLEGRKLEQFDLPDEAAAMRAKKLAEGGLYSVASVEKRRVRRNPPPPFMTSTLQMEASRKLGMGAQQTMRTAQALYEAGHITYMRTDGVTMAREAIAAIRDHVKSEFGPNYMPAAPREYASKAKNAQEAHEAIRPTDVTRSPDTMGGELEGAQARLYDLIWKRAVASQMASAEMDQTTVDIAAKDGRAQFRATGSVIAFDGFLKLYREDEDDRAADARAGILPGAPAEDEDSRILPPMREKEALKHGDIAASQHFTQPPPRYSEASLVKKLEELGIGRPSTYASILQRLQDLKYVSLEKRRFIAQDLGRMVTTFLVRFFEKYVDTGFTSAMEEKLDEISGGRAEWRAVMHAFWDEFSRAVEATKDLKVRDVIDALDEDLGPHIFPARGDGTDPRVCPSCSAGRLGLRLGRGGAFIGCSNYPECRYTRPFGVGPAQGEGAGADRDLGKDPATGQAVTLRRGPYGVYVQLGEAGTDAKGKPTKPRRASLAAGQNPETMTLEAALGLLSLPRVIGIDPESKEEITAGLGRFGPYVRCGSIFKSLDKDDDVLTIGLNRAIALLADARSRIRELGPHPKDGEMVVVRKGRFGPYAQHGRVVANLPRDLAMEDAKLDDMVTLLAEKGKEMKARGAAARKGAKGGARKAAAPAAPAKPAAKAKPKAASAKAKPAAKAKTAAKAKAAAPKPKAATTKAKAKPAARKSSR